MPLSLVIAGLIAIVWHVVLSRMRPGWRLTAVGGARRSAYNAGIDVRRTVCTAYVWSSTLCALAGFLFAARLGSTGSDTGIGMEVSALTAVVLGGNSLGGGRGSVAKALMGALLVLMLNNGLTNLGISGSINSTILGFVLIARRLRRHALAQEPAQMAEQGLCVAGLPVAGAAALGAGDPGSPYALNDKLRSVEIIGLGLIEGPEDIILDRDDNLYCGTRQGDIVRFFGPDHRRHEVFAHIGGHPLGMAFDRDGQSARLHRRHGALPDRARQDRHQADRRDQSQLDLGCRRFPPATRRRSSMSRRMAACSISARRRSATSRRTGPTDALESRGNGRFICYDPKTGRTRTEIPKLVFANGIAMARDGVSFFYAESWICAIKRYYFDGPKKGTIEPVLTNLPGYPDNINRASDGNYWCALLGMRTPALDLAMTMPGFRRRMAKRIAPDLWLYPNINTGCVIKFDEKGNVLESLWDLGGENHPMITSMREHKGWLYLGGVSNNRIGRYRLPDADPTWCGQDSYWGNAR